MKEKLTELINLKEWLEENDDHYLQTVNKKTNQTGYALFFRNSEQIKVFEGAGDGSDDKVMNYTDFVKNYEFYSKLGIE